MQNSIIKFAIKLKITYPVAFVKTHINDAFEENEIGFWEFKSLELGSKQIAIFGQKVLKQNGVHSASANKNKSLIFKK